MKIVTLVFQTVFALYRYTVVDYLTAKENEVFQITINVETSAYLCLSDYVKVFDRKVNVDLNLGRCSAKYDTISYITCSNEITIDHKKNEHGITTDVTTIPREDDLLFPFSCMSEPLIPTSYRCDDRPKRRIIGGIETDRSVFPWVIPYQVRVPGNQYSLCGGAFYDNRTLITAAHCCSSDDPSDYLISNDFSVVEVIVHPDYGKVRSTLKHDICIMKLEVEIQYTGTVQKACFTDKLPEYGQGKVESFFFILLSIVLRCLHLRYCTD